MKNIYIVAVSGGVDSVVLLDMLSKHASSELVVAHFDHGMRSDSQSDALFVKELADRYGFKFETERQELGANASEGTARKHRYVFLNNIVKKYDAKLVTAHHADDVIETIAINLVRSTGWRGLAVLDSPAIYRPLLRMTKRDILDYAQKNKLDWREDHTNADKKYLRNRLRTKLQDFDPARHAQLMMLWEEQLQLKSKIESEVAELLTGAEDYSRYFFIMLDEASAIECIRFITQASLTRPQMRSCLLAIKTAKSGSLYTAGSNLVLEFSPRFFKVKMLK